MPAVPAVSAADGHQLTLRVADPEHALTGVRLVLDLHMPAELLEFRRAQDCFELAFDPPAVWRLEYLLELRYPGGDSKVVTDPANPRQVGGAFGPKSVLELPGYAPPGWLSAPADPGVTTTFESAPGVTARIWAPQDAADEPLPLLVVHDGPEYDALASLTRYLGAGTAAGWLPRLRAALLSPGTRDSSYSASPRYARTLASHVLPALAASLRLHRRRSAWARASAALAMLHAYCGYPGRAGRVVPAVGQLFVPQLDSQERRFRYFRRITRIHRGRASREAARQARSRRHDLRSHRGERREQPPDARDIPVGRLPGDPA